MAAPRTPGPFTLAPGAPVAIIAPAGPVPRPPYALGYERLKEHYRIVFEWIGQPPGLSPTPYLADADHLRAAAFQTCLGRGDVEAIFCARGGYGCARLISLLDHHAFLNRNAPLVGFSDCTALLSWAHIHGIPAVHGPVVTQLGRLPQEDQDALFSLLEGTPTPHLSGLGELVPGSATGPLFAGNLTVLAHLCGTPMQPDLRGHILVIEDVNEAPYRIDRAMTQLLQAGMLHKVRGLVLGEFLNCGPDPSAVEQVLLERVSPLGIPVAMGAPIGHGDRNVALPIGAIARLETGTGILQLV